jgi:hypothetical protein
MEDEVNAGSSTGFMISQAQLARLKKILLQLLGILVHK